MEPLAVLPVFFKLAGKRVVLAGGSEPAAWKAELLSAAGATVSVVAKDPCPGLVALAGSPPGGAVELVRRAWEAADLRGAALAVGAIEDDAEAARFRAAARAEGVPVNVIDRPAFCDFQFGTVVSRSPLVVGISTDGAAPVLGQGVRTRIEAVLPQGLKAWAEAARDWRPAVQALGLGFRARRRFWEALAARAFAGAAPSEADRDACVAEALDERDAPQPCRLTLVCAGPGGPAGLTLGAISALQAADVVLHGPDVDPLVVGFARREAQKLAVGDDAGAVAVDAAPGRHLVWLDRGDPASCLRWQERRRNLPDLAITVMTVSGSGLCPVCRPDCPAWRPGAETPDAQEASERLAR